MRDTQTLARYIVAAMVADEFGISLAYALKRYVPDEVDPSYHEIARLLHEGRRESLNQQFSYLTEGSREIQ